ncbi:MULTISPECIES: hypothetical protein [Sorangium]|uniref:hypothetical protein n=1 Tax=Sorangium TaxID=39643 RepID=UPI003D9BFFF4
MRRRAAAEVDTDVQLVTPTVCAGSLAERKLPARLSVSPEQLRAQLTRLLQGSQVARTTGGWASVQLTPGASPAVGDEARAVGPGAQDNTTGMVTRVAEGRAEVLGQWPDRPFATGDYVFFGGPLWSFSLTPEARVSVPNAVNLGVDFEVYRTHHGPLVGMGVGWLVGVGDSARVGGSGAHLYGGYLLWLSPTRFGLYLRGDAGMGGVWGTEKPFVHVGIAAGLKWRVPSVMVLDASGGYDVGPSVTLGPAGSARPLSFAWHGPSARLTFAIDNQLLPRTSGYTEQMPCIMVGCDEHARWHRRRSRCDRHGGAELSRSDFRFLPGTGRLRHDVGCRHQSLSSHGCHTSACPAPRRLRSAGDVRAHNLPGARRRAPLAQCAPGRHARGLARRAGAGPREGRG